MSFCFSLDGRSETTLSSPLLSFFANPNPRDFFDVAPWSFSLAVREEDLEAGGGTGAVLGALYMSRSRGSLSATEGGAEIVMTGFLPLPPLLDDDVFVLGSVALIGVVLPVNMAMLDAVAM